MKTRLIVNDKTLMAKVIDGPTARDYRVPAAIEGDSLSGHFDDYFAEISALQHPDKSPRRCFKALHYLFTIANLAVGH